MEIKSTPAMIIIDYILILLYAFGRVCKVLSANTGKL